MIYFWQSAALDLKQSDSEILRYLILSLDENGFLTESASESARILKVSEQQVQSNIVRLQSMEPAGIGAANLSDCLVLQLQRMTPVNSIAVQIAASFLDQLAKQQTGTIAKALGVTRAEVLEACELIRTLNPRPMNGLGVRSETPYILPDFYITEENGQLHIIMNDYYLPKIIIDPTYQQIIQSGTLDKSDQEYIQKNYKEAEEIVNFISYRKSTMQKVMQYILHAQKAFFLSGPGHRTAMNNAEIAAALNLHESTISRAVTGKFFQCKWGVYPLRSLFTHRIHEADTDRFAAAAGAYRRRAGQAPPTAINSSRRFCLRTACKLRGALSSNIGRSSVFQPLASATHTSVHNMQKAQTGFVCAFFVYFSSSRTKIREMHIIL